MKLFTAATILASVSASNPFTPKNSRKSSYVSKLVDGAIPTRRLEEAEEYEVDISSYYVKFEQCQFVKSYDDELAEDEDSASVLATKRFALFRLCPNGCSSCNEGYGEYLIDLDEYLQATVEYFQDYQEEMCNTCNEVCYQDANEEEAEEEENQDGEEDNGEERRRLQDYYNVDCSTCLDDCQKIENMEENGYVDATEFLECQMVYDPEDDNKAALYAGPICVNNGKKIKIGVFSDEDCLILDSSKEVDDYLADGDGYSMKLSHALLKSTYIDTCISCKEPVEDDENDQGDDAEDADEVIEMCEQLYDAAAKCEAKYGFDNGYSMYEGYENQASQENTVCDFMSSLKSGTYDESGEIIVSGSRVSGSGGKATSGGQKFALTFFILGTLGLAGYAAVLHSKLIKGGKADLASTGGAMA